MPMWEAHLRVGLQQHLGLCNPVDGLPSLPLLSQDPEHAHEGGTPEGGPSATSGAGVSRGAAMMDHPAARVVELCMASFKVCWGARLCGREAVRLCGCIPGDRGVENGGLAKHCCAW
eukprot:1139125-Pelagomonas_calceolata.AAC.12